MAFFLIYPRLTTSHDLVWSGGSSFYILWESLVAFFLDLLPWLQVWEWASLSPLWDSFLGDLSPWLQAWEWASISPLWDSFYVFWSLVAFFLDLLPWLQVWEWASLSPLWDSFLGDLSPWLQAWEWASISPLWDSCLGDLLPWLQAWEWASACLCSWGSFLGDLPWLWTSNPTAFNWYSYTLSSPVYFKGLSSAWVLYFCFS